MGAFHLLNGQKNGHTIDFTGQPEVVVGQSGVAGVPLPDEWVSWEHARVFQQNGTYYIEDLGSTNGTFVNCVPTEGAVPLAHRDLIFFGRTHALFLDGDLAPPSAEEQAPFTLNDESGETLGDDFELLDFDDLQIA